jgi:hypothetical protein
VVKATTVFQRLTCKRFLMLKEAAPDISQINVVLNWFEELKRLVPTN